MCTYVTKTTAMSGAAKGPSGWFTLTESSVYVDHPYRAPFEHSLNIDFLGTGDGAASRVAVELSLGSARELIACIETALERAAVDGAR